MERQLPRRARPSGRPNCLEIHPTRKTQFFNQFKTNFRKQLHTVLNTGVARNFDWEGPKLEKNL